LLLLLLLLLLDLMAGVLMSCQELLLLEA